MFESLRRNKALVWIFIALTYIVVSLALTYPLGLEADALVGPKEDSDNLQSFWNATHFERWMDGEVESLFSTDNLYYPNGSSLLLHTLSPLNIFIQYILRFLCPIFMLTT